MSAQPPESPVSSVLDTQAWRARLETLMDRGDMLQAHAEAALAGDYRHWRGAEEMALAARLVGHLGAPRLAETLGALALRRHPHDPRARLLRARYLLSRHGQYQAWRFLWHTPAPQETGLRAEWLAFSARLHALLRDFERSAALLGEVAELDIDDPWLSVERSYCLELEDRHEEALAQVLALLERAPWHRAGLQQAAKLEIMLNRRDAALARLREGAERMRSASLQAQLSELLIEMEALDEAEHWLARGEANSPLLEPQLARWYAARRCDIAGLRSDHGRAREQAALAGPGFYQVLHERLAEPSGERRLLPVEFVLQHHMTCVPATLSALSGYWGRPAAHLEIAEEICYDGTSHQAERAWAERNGWLAIEFTVDWATSRALIERGVPFTLTVQYTGSGHLQAVVGYDEPRGTLLLRDPGQAQFGECLAEQLLRHQAVSGPRGMLLLPPEEAARLDGLELPEQQLWDLYYQMLSALEGHRRDEAHERLERLRERAPGHRLGLQAERALAWYDGDETQVLAANEALLRLFPEDANLILAKASSLSLLQSRQAQLEWLEQHEGLGQGEPMVRLRQAQLLAEDGRRGAELDRLLARVLRQAPGLGQAWNALASLRWEQGAREEAAILYRVAACLQGTHEGYGAQYFRALRCLGRTEEGLDFLRARQRRLGRKAAWPTLTLAELLEELDQGAQVGPLLEAALAHRPEDADLLLALVDFHGRSGEPQRGREILQRAEPLCRRATWLRAAVLLSHRAGDDPQQALAWCREAVALEPLNLSLQRMLLDLLDQVQGAQAADAHLDGQLARFPHHRGLAELRVERAQRLSPAATEQALRHLLDSHPLFAWALRELAVCLARQGRRDEALGLARQALEIDPSSSSSHSTLGFVLLQDGQRQAAREAFEQALRCSADNDYASAMLLDTCANHEQALQTIAWLHGELVRQVTFGGGWLAYQGQARDLVPDDELLQQLQAALQQRGDLWQLWVATAQQLLRCGQDEQAEHLLQTAIERFPLLPRMSLEWAQLLKRRGALEECLGVLESSFRINPLWGMSVRLYVETLLDIGERLEQAEQVLRRVLQRTPDNTELRGFLAYVLGERGNLAEAADEAERVLGLEPGHEWAWNQLRDYAARLDDGARPQRLARELVQARAGDVDAWLALADQADEPDERERALREALRCNPLHRGANERLLERLLADGRYEELREHLGAACWDGVVPVELALYQARALHAQGQVQEALASLAQLLEAQPNCFVAWRYLADWRETGEDWAGYVAASREMVRLAPQYAIAHGYLGHALLLAEQEVEALPSFEQAAALDPDYLFASLNAYDLTRKHGKPAQAAEKLRAMLDHGEQPAVLLRALRHALDYGDQELKRRALSGLCQRPEAEEAWPEAQGMLVRADHDKLLLELLAAGAAAGSLNGAAARYWLQLEDERWLPGSLWAAFEKSLANDSRHNMKRAMLNLLATRQNGRGLLLRALERCRPQIASDDLLWATASYAMLNHALHFMMFDWLADWRERDGLPAWGLDNLAVALRTQARDAEAGAVSAASLAREPDNREAMLWLAFDGALQGEQVTVESYLQRLGEQPLRPFFQCMRHLLEGWAAAWREGDSRAACLGFDAAKAVAKTAAHPAYQRLRKALGLQLVRAGMTPAWQRPWRYLRLRW